MKTNIPDDLNPDYLFSGVFTDLLVKIWHGDINCEQRAEQELAKRGLDTNGVWVGFKKKEV